MSAAVHPKLQGIDIESSYILGVIYDDTSLTLEMDYKLLDSHDAYIAPADDEEGCFAKGFLRFALIEELALDKADKAKAGEEVDYSDIYSVKAEGSRFEISGGWGEIKVVARSISVALD